MDVTSDKNLFNFIENLGKEEVNISEGSSSSSSISSSTPAPTGTTDNLPGTQPDDIWIDITNALESWTQKILDVESRCNNKAVNFRQTIEESLQRQKLDGFLTNNDLTELRYIADVWSNLLNATSCYAVGCIFVKRDIITYLLELYSLRQITSGLFIEACLKL